MIVIFTKILSIFIMIALGFLAIRVKALKVEAQPHLSKFIVLFSLPCMILSSITSHELTDDTTGITLRILLLGVIFYVMSAMLGYILSKYVFKTGENLGVYMFSFSTNNTGFMGFPLIIALYGQEYFFYIAMFNIVMSTYCNSIGPIVVHLGSDKKNKISAKMIIKSLLSPITICIVISLVMLFNRWHLPSLIFNVVDTIGDTVVPLSLFVVGMQLGNSKFKEIIKDKTMVWLTWIKMIALPIALFFIANCFNLPSEAKICAILGGALPAAAIAPAIANSEGKNSLIPAEMVVFGTIISLVEVPLIVRFFQFYYGI